MGGVSIRKIGLRHKSLLLSSVAFAAFNLPAFGQTPILPTGGQVTAGQVAISAPTNNTLTISQSSQAAIIGWQTFSIGHGGTVQFNNGAGATLNRVTGNVPSQIDGLLSATGSVYLVNPAGVAVGTSGQVATGGSFIASTQDVSNAEFMAGKSMTFRGASEASVVNYGRIGSLGGDVALIARQVENHGSISAPNGTAALAAGYEVLMRDAALSDGKFMVKVGGAATAAKTTGAIKAAEVELRANGGNVYALAGNTRSVTKATGVASKGGRVFLTAGDGSVTVTQKIAARKATKTSAAAGKRVRDGGEIAIAAGQVHLGGTLDVRGERGGTVDVLGATIALTGAVIDASGKTGGGTVHVGGGWQGKGDLRRAETTTVDAATSITADAIANGDGGTVVVWSDQVTSFAGTISARGGSHSGDGGNAEVSGKALLAYAGFTDLSAANGSFGTLLLDPYNVVISNGAHGGNFTATGDDSIINADTLMTALTRADVFVSTGTAGDGFQAGDITVAAPVFWSTGTKLTLQAAGDILVNADIAATGTGAGLALDYGAGRGYSLGNGAAITLSGANPSLSIGGQSYTVIQNVDQLQNMQNGLSGRYALGVDIDASATAGWNGGAGFVPVGDNSTFSSLSRFTGAFDGLGHVVSGLVIDRPSTERVGLFGHTENATIANVELDGGSVRGAWYVGGLVGYQEGGSIAQSWATGTVTGTGSSVGGLVGVQGGGSISQSWATGAVTGSSSYVGGLVGWQYGGSISQSWASGEVTGSSNDLGGLVGYQSSGGRIDESHATGVVKGIAGSWHVGGLVGHQDGIVSRSYATGAVTSNGETGGLVGYQGSGSISQSWASGKVEGLNYVGGLVGYQSGGSIAASFFDTTTTRLLASQGVGNIADAPGVTAIQSADPADANYAFNRATYSGFDFGADWFIIDGETRPFGRWEHSTTIHNAHQLQLMAMDLGASYRLAADIDLGAALADPAQMWKTAAAGSAQYGFVPVGNSNNRFTGAFYGQGHVISGLTIDRPSTDYVGLFGGTQNATIQSVGLDGVTIIGLRKVGGLVGEQSGGSIERSWVSGAVTAKDQIYVNYVGGLVGHQLGGSISQSWATGSVTGLDFAGGLVGYQGSGSIAQSWATGAVMGTHSAGGLVGAQYGSIVQSYATGRVEGTGNVGGLVGAGGGSILQSWATGEVTGTGSRIGGLVGEQYGGGSIEQSWAARKVEGLNSVGGLVGYQQGSIEQSYANGGVEGADDVGGLVGYQRSGSITQSYTTGVVTGTGSYVGGLVGYQGGGSIVQSWSTGRVEGNSDVGGLVGYQYVSGSISQSWATGEVTGANRVGGLVGSSSGNISQAYATGTVTGTGSNVGGLVGWQTTGDIVRSWATNDVAGVERVGGLVGRQNNGSISQSWASGAVKGSNVIGGLVGYQDRGIITQSWVTSAVEGNDYVGGLVGFQGGGSIVQSWAAGKIGGDSSTGGLVGDQGGGSIAASFFDTTTTGLLGSEGVGNIANAPGVIGLTTAQFQDTGGFMALAGGQGWDFETVWAPPSAGFYPELYALSPVVRVDAQDASRLYGDANPAPVEAGRYGGPGSYVFGPAGDTLGFAAGLQWTAAPTSGVGVYGVTGLASAVSAEGVTYRIVHTGALDVAPRPITVTAADAGKVYGETVSFAGSEFTADGLVNGDRVDGVTLSSTGAAASAGVNGGTPYAIEASGATGTGLENYTITFKDGALTITPKALTVTADAQQKVASQPDPNLTWQVTSGSLVNGDGLTGGLARSPGEAAGDYAIIQGTLAASANYALSFVGNVLRITPASAPAFPDPGSLPPTTFEHAGTVSQPGFQTGPIAAMEQADASNKKSKSSLASGCSAGALAGQCAGLPHPDNLSFGLWLSVSAN